MSFLKKPFCQFKFFNVFKTWALDFAKFIDVDTKFNTLPPAEKKLCSFLKVPAWKINWFFLFLYASFFYLIVNFKITYYQIFFHFCFLWFFSIFIDKLTKLIIDNSFDIFIDIFIDNSLIFLLIIHWYFIDIFIW